MTISYPINLPTSPGYAAVDFRTMSRVGVSRDPFVGTQQAYAWPGQWLEADVTLPLMTRAEAAEWIASLVSLNGKEGTFYLGDPAGATPRGSAPGTPLVSGSNSARSETLVTKGWTISQTGILKKGDWIQIGSSTERRLYMILTDTNSDGSGNATLDIFPSLRETLANNTAITTASCKGVFRLASNTTQWSINEATHYGIQFSAYEAF